MCTRHRTEDEQEDEAPVPSTHICTMHRLTLCHQTCRRCGHTAVVASQCRRFSTHSSAICQNRTSNRGIVLQGQRWSISISSGHQDGLKNTCAHSSAEHAPANDLRSFPLYILQAGQHNHVDDAQLGHCQVCCVGNSTRDCRHVRTTDAVCSALSAWLRSCST